MQDDAHLAVIALFEDKALIDEDVAVIFSEEMDIALHDGQIIVQDMVQLAVPNLHPWL